MSELTDLPVWNAEEAKKRAISSFECYSWYDRYRFHEPAERSEDSCKVVIINASDGTVISESSFAHTSEGFNFAEEQIKQIFDSGEYESKFVQVVRTQIDTLTVFSPDALLEHYRKEDAACIAREKRDGELRLALEKEQKRFDDWDAATNWCRENGIKLRPGHVRRKTMIKAAVKAGKVEAFNEHWPQFKIKESECESVEE